MTDTPRTGLEFVDAGTTDIDQPVNNNALALDAVLGMSAVSVTTTAEPTLSSPGDDGEVYILPAGRTGTNWGAQAVGTIAQWYSGNWYFYAPWRGLRARAQDSGVLYEYTTAWEAFNSTDALTLYVATTGSDSNSGLSALSPLLTLQEAFDRLESYGPVISRSVTINLAAGTYTEGGLFPAGLRSIGEVVIQGPAVGGSPNVPTAIIDGTSSGYRRGIGGSNRLRVRIKDVKIQNFSATDEAGIEFSMYCRVYLDNVHVDNCYYGWHFLDFVYYDAFGGIIENCDTGIQELFGVVRNLKVATSDAERTTIRDCTSYGLKAKELCTGHLDYALIDNCNIGISLNRNSTANLANCDIYNNAVGAALNGSSEIVDVPSTDWGAGTSNANTVKFLNRGGSCEIVRNGGENVPAAPYVGLTEKKVGFDYDTVTHTGTAVRTSIYPAIYESQAGDFQAVGGHFRGRVYGNATTLAGTCQIELRTNTGGMATVTLPVGTNGAFVVEFNFMNTTGGDNQQHYTTATPLNAVPIVANGTRTVAFSSNDLTMEITATLSNSADTVIFRGAELFTTEA